MLSLNVNRGAQQALQVLGANSTALAATRAKVATGLAVAGTKDDSAAYVIAQGLRSDVLGWKAVGESLTRWQSITDVATAGAEQIGDLVNLLKQKAYGYADAAGDAKSQAAIRADMEALLDQIDTIGNSAEFGGVNLLRGKPVTSTNSSYDYISPDSTIDPAPFLVPMAALPPGSTRGFDTYMHYQLPPSALTPPAFAAAQAHLGGSLPQVVAVDGGDTAGRVNLLLDTMGNAGKVEIWQHGTRVAASGQPYAAAGVPVASATPLTGPSVISFDYDPAKGKDLELRINQGVPGSNQWRVWPDGLQLQDPSQPVPTPFGLWNNFVGWSSTGQFDPPVQSASPEQVTRAMDDPLDVRMQPTNNSATYTLNGGPEAGRVDMTFEAFELPDKMEVWQNGVRIGATGQPYAAGGGAVAAGVPVTGTNVVSFDYDPALGPVTFSFNEGGADPNSSWAVGSVTMRKNRADPIVPPTPYVGSSQTPSFGPARYDFNVTPGEDQARISSRDLSTANLGIGRTMLRWRDPQAVLTAIDAAATQVQNAAAYLGRHHQALGTRLATLGKLSDTLQGGIGNLVDADLAKEAASLQAGEAKQQLAAQALAIANQAPQLLLSLFR